MSTTDLLQAKFQFSIHIFTVAEMTGLRVVLSEAPQTGFVMSGPYIAGYKYLTYKDYCFPTAVSKAIVSLLNTILHGN